MIISRKLYTFLSNYYHVFCMQTNPFPLSSFLISFELEVFDLSSSSNKGNKRMLADNFLLLFSVVYKLHGELFGDYTEAVRRYQNIVKLNLKMLGYTKFKLEYFRSSKASRKVSPSYSGFNFLFVDFHYKIWQISANWRGVVFLTHPVY